MPVGAGPVPARGPGQARPLLLVSPPRSAQAEHVPHVVEARRLADEPFRRSDGAAREDLATRRLVAELEALAGRREDDRVLAGDVAAAQRGEADIAAPPWSGLAVAHALRDAVEIDAAAFRRGAAEGEGGAGRCVDLVAMVHLEHLDVVIGAEPA